MAEDVVDRIVKSRGLSDKAGPCVTPEIRLRGGVGYSRNLPIQLVQQFGVTEAVAEHLARTYGTHACDVMKTKSAKTRGGALLLSGYPYLEEEVEYAMSMGLTVTTFSALLEGCPVFVRCSNALEVEKSMSPESMVSASASCCCSVAEDLFTTEAEVRTEIGQLGEWFWFLRAGKR